MPPLLSSDAVPAYLMAVAALATVWTGTWLSKRGQKDTREQQAAATALQTRVNTVDELESVIAHLKEERDHLAQEAERLRRQNSAEAAQQAARCQVQLDRAIENIATLQSIVTDEIARAAALDAVRGAQTHEETDHGRQWDADETRY